MSDDTQTPPAKAFFTCCFCGEGIVEDVRIVGEKELNYFYCWDCPPKRLVAGTVVRITERGKEILGIK